MLGRTRSRGSLIVQNRKTVNEEVDGLDIAGPHGQPSVNLRHTKSSHVYAVSTQTRTSRMGALPLLYKEERKRSAPMRRRLNRAHAVIGRAFPRG